MVTLVREVILADGEEFQLCCGSDMHDVLDGAVQAVLLLLVLESPNLFSCVVCDCCSVCECV